MWILVGRQGIERGLECGLLAIAAKL